ncbi:MAG: 5-formyltetrahydrofolate cyclo-ligase [Sphaerochaeta sp.]|nr:5-formyltetrahydrofolate cyclo-ligase [Sphaerochaeta sp.]
MYEKDALRAKMREKTQQYTTMDFVEEDLRSCGVLLECKRYQECGVLFAFHPLASEVDITPILENAITTRRLALPRTEADGSLTFFIVTDLALLRRGRFAIAEPHAGELVVPTPTDLMLIPALAYDRAHRRLGRGKGYYDRYLKQNNTVATVGVCRSYQLVDTIPTQAWDRRVDHVLCAGTLY